ncbi:MAG: HD domain-containing protein [Nitrospirae bacterium]|nr:HD domain-containing protein [Nitrospirota bacterium]
MKIIIPVLLRSWFEDGLPEGLGLYLVGGTVRDLLLRPKRVAKNVAPKDMDLVCRNAKSLALNLAARKNAALVTMGKKTDEHSPGFIPICGGECSPCYRVVDRERPEAFLDIAEMRGDAIEEDLGRRDFTINAMAIRLNDEGLDGELLDPFDGAGDIQKKIIRMVSREAFVSDPLRILRAFRFAASLSFTIEEQTLNSMQSNAVLLKRVSVERVMAELQCILLSSKSAVWFRKMDDLGILAVILPEILPMKGCEQNWYHHKDVWEHSLLVMEKVEEILSDLSRFGEASAGIAAMIDREKTGFLKLAGLLHDMGKPFTRGIKPGSSRIIFYGHDKAGAERMKEMAGRLKLSCRLRDFLVKMVAEHLKPLSLSSPEAKPAARLRWFRKMRDDVVPALILSMADVMSSLGPEASEQYRLHFIAWAEESIREYFTFIKPQLEAPLLINGDDLISLGMKPGIALGSLLCRLRFAQDLGKITSRREALKLAGDMIAGQAERRGAKDTSD